MTRSTVLRRASRAARAALIGGLLGVFGVTSAGVARAESRPSGVGWSSGVYAHNNAADAAAFASWRGLPLDVITVFPRQDSWASINDDWYVREVALPSGFTGDLVVAVPLWPRNSNVSADNTAGWQDFARQLAGRDPNAYVRLGWEMNIPAMYWRLTDSNRAQWAAAFHRAATAMHAVAPHLRIVWNPNWGADQTGVDSRAVFQAVKDDVDVYAIDMYDSWPAELSDVLSQVRLNTPGGLAESLSYARANGKTFALAEWGVACNGGGCQWQGNAGADNPRYIATTLNFLQRNAKDVAFDSYFNDGEDYLRSILWPTATNSRAGAQYRSLLAQFAR